MWIAVESLRCAEHELESVAARYKVPLELVRCCRRIAFRALEEAFWKEDPCRMVPPPRHRRRHEEQTPAREAKPEHNPEQFVESLLHRVHERSQQPLPDHAAKSRGRRPGARGETRQAAARRRSRGRKSTRPGADEK